MNRTEAKQRLMQAFPGRTVCITINDWHNEFSTGRSADHLEYKVSLLPGWDGSECTCTSAATLERSVQLALDWVPLIKEREVTAEEADEHFANELEPVVTGVGD